MRRLVLLPFIALALAVAGCDTATPSGLTADAPAIANGRLSIVGNSSLGVGCTYRYTYAVTTPGAFVLIGDAASVVDFGGNGSTGYWIDLHGEYPEVVELQWRKSGQTAPEATKTITVFANPNNVCFGV